MAKASTMKKITTSAKKVDDLTSRLAAEKFNLDAAVRAARDEDAKYREIAEAAERSTAWVQNALERTGYKSKRRAKTE